MTRDRRPWSEQDIAELKEMAGKLTPKGSGEETETH